MEAIQGQLRVRAGLHWKIVSGFAEEIRALPVLEEVDRANLSVAEEYLRWLEGNTPSRYQELPTFQESSVCIFPSNRTRAVPEEATVPETPAPAWFLGENGSRAVPEEASSLHLLRIPLGTVPRKASLAVEGLKGLCRVIRRVRNSSFPSLSSSKRYQAVSCAGRWRVRSHWNAPADAR